MRFQITMNMPSRSGNSVHQIIGDYPVDSLEGFLTALSNRDFVIVEEVYRDNDATKAVGNYYSVGKIALNHIYVGKIKVLKE